MDTTQKDILKIITDVWNEHPHLRFGQLLSGLGVVEFANKTNPEWCHFNLKDIFYNNDEDMLKRIKSSVLYTKYFHEKYS